MARAARCVRERHKIRYLRMQQQLCEQRKVWQSYRNRTGDRDVECRSIWSLPWEFILRFVSATSWCPSRRIHGINGSATKAHVFGMFTVYCIMIYYIIATLNKHKLTCTQISTSQEKQQAGSKNKFCRNAADVRHLYSLPLTTT